MVMREKKPGEVGKSKIKLITTTGPNIGIAE
jgi:hypothetical protein